MSIGCDGAHHGANGAAEAASEMGLADVADFMACLEARKPSCRAAVLRDGAVREAGRLERRVALRRALEASPSADTRS